ncbi:hypothetical protein ABLE68_19175 [Nocardioides sp. CN2-186]|uniref:hypothetical protein n=1 Tax=Nocardioides tweenelious TaxID=3156607 RepID=UPI0032B42E9B
MDEEDDDAPIRGEVRLASHERISHGLYRRKRHGLTSDDQFVRELECYQLVLPANAVFTHLTGARLLGWQLPKLPEQVPVFAAVGVRDPRPRRHGLLCSRLVRTPRPRRGMGGLPVDDPEEILLRAARDLGVLDLVVLIDSALAKGHLDRQRMAELLATRRPGVRMLRVAYELSDHRAESGPETVLRLFHRAIAVGVQPQVELFDDRGTSIGRVDLLVVGTAFVHEYDGAHHRDQAQHRSDLRRERRFADSPYVRRGFTLDDLLNHPAIAMHEIDRTLDRPHDLRRLAVWRRVVDNSLYSEVGRERVMNRWRRQQGIIDWSRTA